MQKSFKLPYRLEQDIYFIGISISFSITSLKLNTIFLSFLCTYIFRFEPTGDYPEGEHTTT
ncbi:MAG: hypothetical protein JXA77_03270 [Bacteroidales bacterium]|nr:hypothetical protein [Bacteroidales bacterium]MBN2817547.1 hypothetical protein [Bacteroidales bacterium]